MMNIRFLRFVVTITTLLLSACGGAAATPTSIPEGGRAEPIPVAFIGMVDSIAGDQWVINGQTVTVAQEVIQDGSFQVGDQVKVEGVVNADGSFTVSSLETPTPQDASGLPQFGNPSSSGAGNENSANENSSNQNESNENSANENGSNENEANENGNNENGSNENASNENEANENGSNENESNENSGNENESNENENNNENSSNENEANENGSNSND